LFAADRVDGRRILLVSGVPWPAAAIELQEKKPMLCNAFCSFIAGMLRVSLGEGGGGAVDDPLRGVWALVSYSAKDVASGEVIYPYGERAKGYLIYAEGRRMSALVTAEDRKPLSAMPGRVEERAEAFSTSTAYMGTYRWEGDRVVHDVDVAVNPSWVGVQQVRNATLAGNRLTLTIPPAPMQPDGKVRVGTLVWERI